MANCASLLQKIMIRGRICCKESPHRCVACISLHQVIHACASWNVIQSRSAPRRQFAGVKSDVAGSHVNPVGRPRPMQPRSQNISSPFPCYLGREAKSRSNSPSPFALDIHRRSNLFDKRFFPQILALKFHSARGGKYNTNICI